MALNLILKSSVILLVGNSFSAIASFVRNIIIARLISVEDFGIAMLFALTMSAIEMASNLAIDKIIIQDKEGDDENFQATSQTFQLIRGFVGGVILYFFAKYVAFFFKVPEAVWAFQLLALYPVIKGLTHLDASRFQRKMNFLPLMWAEAIPLLVSLLLSWPLTIWFGDYSVMIWLLLIQVSLFVLLTHIYAERKFNLQWNSKVVKRIYLFGWPLLVNGILMFAILQGDKAIIGSMFTMETLGWYSAAFSLTLGPAMLLVKVSQSVLLPVLSRHQDNDNLFIQQSVLTIQLCLLMGVSLTFFFIFFGGDLLMLLFGEKYSSGIEVVAYLGFMQGLRVIKAGPMLVALACANTKNPMISNSVRGLAFAASIAAAGLGYGINTLVIIAILGEVCAFFVSILMLGKFLNTSFWKHIPITLLFLLIATLVIQFGPFVTVEQPIASAVKLLTLLVSVLFFLYLMPEVRRYFLQIIHKKTHG